MSTPLPAQGHAQNSDPLQAAVARLQQSRVALREQSLAGAHDGVRDNVQVHGRPVSNWGPWLSSISMLLGRGQSGESRSRSIPLVFRALQAAQHWSAKVSQHAQKHPWLWIAAAGVSGVVLNRLGVLGAWHMFRPGGKFMGTRSVLAALLSRPLRQKLWRMTSRFATQSLSSAAALFMQQVSSARAAKPSAEKTKHSKPQVNPSPSSQGARS